MNPLSPFTYCRRHKRWAAMLTALLALTVLGLYLFIGLAQATYIAPAYTINRYLEKFSLVQPQLVETLDPDVVARIQANGDVTQVLLQNDVNIKVSNVGGAYFPFRLIGLQEADVATVLAQCGVSLKEGELPQPNTNGVALSEEIVTALGLKIGDTFDRTKDEKVYFKIVSPLRLVGVLAGEVRLGIVSYDYLNNQESYRSLTDSGLLVIAREGREAAVADYLQHSVRDSQTKIYTRQSTTEQVARDQQLLYALGIPIVLLVMTALTLVIGAIHQLTFAQRLQEFGTLHSLGHSKEWLARRLTLETAGLAVAGWGLGILLAWGGLAILSATVYAPGGFAFSPIQLTALPFVLPIPLAAIGLTLFTAIRTLGSLDTVAIVERGELSLEGERPGRPPRVKAGSLPRPLAPSTFYRRHTRQAAVLVSAMVLMIVGTALIIFIFSAGADALQPMLNNFSRISAVSPNNLPLYATVIDQIRTHPAVERVIPVYTFAPVKISIPPMFPSRSVETLCVTEEDMAYMVDLYHLKLAEGHLPRPNTNEIVFPWAIAQNRDIHVGDVIGDPDHPIYPGAPALPIQLVVSGIFAQGETSADETWLPFMSLEFVEQYRESELSLIVVPRTGQKAALDAWLKRHIAGEGRMVYTYKNQRAALQREMSTMLFTFALMESAIALAAALALAGLNTIFVSQRQAEFGVLNAMGFSRPQLVGRVVRETFFTAGAAWLVAMLGCAVIQLGLQNAVFTPAGLKLNFFNPTPWLFTLLLPAAVLAANAGAVARMLARLDPVAIIEGR
ncbi:MAG: ABC transporter permease [Thermoflexales bacterium]|nr:ABC transporter permease [Thermoflexales bacterium]